MPPSRRPFTFLSPAEWTRIWLKTAAVGTTVILVLFAGYEIIERVYLRYSKSTEDLFRFHILRGAGSSILVGTVAVYTIWRARRDYDRAFAAAYREIEDAVSARSRALEQAQAFTERLFDALRERLIVVDGRGVVVKANRVALEGRGEPVIGKRCSMLGTACSPSEGACVAMKAQRTRLPVVGQCVRTDSETGRIYSVDAYPVPDIDGQGPLVIEASHDITQEKQMEALLRHQEKLAALGVLASGIAHDIANPLASMSSELEMLAFETEGDHVRSSIRVLRDQVSRIDRVLREMTDFARRRGEDATIVPVHVAVGDALRMVRHHPRARKVSFEVSAPEDLPRVRIVEDHLAMVLVNLLINAFDAMPEGGTLALVAAHRGDKVTIEVKDTGTGMTSEVKRRAMEPLFTTKAKGRGTGLGLAVSADVLRAAGGSLSIDSALGKGTTMTVALPIYGASPLSAGAGEEMASCPSVF